MEHHPGLAIARTAVLPGSDVRVSTAYPILAGVFEPGARFDGASAKAVLGRPFGHDIAADTVPAGALALARTPALGTAEHDACRTLCMLVGGVYNLAEVAKAEGRDPAGSPEEILAAAYESRGANLLEGLSGAFVLLLWDRHEGVGLVAQDQLGSRSLYYNESGSRLHFASEVFPLLQMLPRRPPPLTVGVVSLAMNYPPPADLTHYEGVRKVTGGHYLRLAAGGWERTRYWAPRYRPPDRRGAAELGEQLWEETRRAVRARVGDGERAGIIMSGGLDSSVVAAAAASQDLNVRGYSAVFPENPEIDESPRVELLAKRLGLPITQVEVRPQGVVALTLEYLNRWDIPLTGPGLVLEHPLAALAADDAVTVLLDGQGGDEVFGFSPYLTADRLRHGRVLSSLRLTRSFPMGSKRPWRHTAAVWRRFAFKGALPYFVHHAARRLHGPERYAPHFLNRESAQILFEASDPWSWKRDPGGPLWWAFKVSLTTRGWEETRLPEYLRHRAAMGGLEARPPLIDIRLVELALTIPPELDFSRHHDRPVIREGLRGRVPEKVRLWHQKSNLGPFFHDALLTELQFISRLLLADDAEVRAFVQPEAVRTLLAEPPRIGTRRWLWWSSWVWALVNVECWLQQQRDSAFAGRMLESGDVQRPASRLYRTPDPGLVSGS
jgi:asparagine synthase (glutamine-hydrolysing)